MGERGDGAIELTSHITTCRAEHDIPIRTSCRAFGVSESWYYKHRNRPTLAREARREELTDAIWDFYEASGGTYGSPRIVLDLWEAGWQVSVNSVAEIMAAEGMKGRERPTRRSLTRQGKRPAAPDLVDREFTADAPDELWCGDVTMIRTGEGPLYLATVMDLFSRRMLGYAMSAHHDTTLTTASMKMATATRGGDVAGVIFHSDRGGEYTGKNFNNLCDFLNVNQSMGRVASALDNAAAESVNSTLKTEFTHRRVFATRADARKQIGGWISNFYNARRRHSWCGGISPIAMENAYQQDQQHPAEDQPVAGIRSAA